MTDHRARATRPAYSSARISIPASDANRTAFSRTSFQRHPRAAERLPAPNTREIAAAKLDPLQAGARERRPRGDSQRSKTTSFSEAPLKSLSPMRQSRKTTRSSFASRRPTRSTRHSSSDDIAERRFGGGLGTRRPTAQKLDPAGREPEAVVPGPVDVVYDGIDEVAELDPRPARRHRRQAGMARPAAWTRAVRPRGSWARSTAA